MTERIDIHVHVYEPEVARRALSNIRAFRANAGIKGVEIAEDGTPEYLLRQMDSLGIARSVIQAVVTRPEAMGKVNAWTAGVAKRSGGRLHAFGGIHPLAGDVEIADEIKRFKDEYGFLGIKLHPTMQGFDPLCPEARRLYDRAARAGLAILIHPDHREAFQFGGSGRANLLTNDKLCELIEAHPGLRLIAAHLGAMHTERLETAIRESPDAWLDVAILKIFYPYDPAEVAAIIRRFGVDKVIFGSDFPFWPADAALAYLDRLSLTPEEREQIEVTNPRRFLGF